MSEADRDRAAASDADGADSSGGIPTDTRGAGAGGVGSVSGVSGVGTIGTSFGVAGNIPEPPGVEEEPVVIENEDDPDAIAHRGERRGRIAPDGVGPEVLPPS